MNSINSKKRNALSVCRKAQHVKGQQTHFSGMRPSLCTDHLVYRSVHYYEFLANKQAMTTPVATLIAHHEAKNPRNVLKTSPNATPLLAVSETHWNKGDSPWFDKESCLALSSRQHQIGSDWYRDIVNISDCVLMIWLRFWHPKIKYNSSVHAWVFDWLPHKMFDSSVIPNKLTLGESKVRD